MRLEVPSFPMFKLSQFPSLVSELSLSPSSYLDLYNESSGKWEQATIETVSHVLSSRRVLFRSRKSLLEGLSDEDCPGLDEELSTPRATERPRMAPFLVPQVVPIPHGPVRLRPVDPPPVSASESPPGRSNILPSFLRRPRAPQSAHPVQPTLNTAINRDTMFLLDDPPPPTAISPGTSQPQSASHRRRHPQQGGSNIIQPSISATAPSSSSLGLSHMLRRRRSVGTVTPNLTTITPLESRQASPPSASAPTHRIRLVPHLDSRGSLKFDPISRDLREGDPALRIGRFTDRSGLNAATVNALNSNKLAFKSKVVSRAHAEIWVDSGGKFLIRDTKSSSGTFLNHTRLSAAGKESKPFPLKDGDVLQLGVDYQGGTEDIYKSVKIKIELGREWQAAANAFKCVNPYISSKFS